MQQMCHFDVFLCDANIIIDPSEMMMLYDDVDNDNNPIVYHRYLAYLQAD